MEIWLSDLNGSDQQSAHRTLTLTNAYTAQHAVRLTIMTDNAPEEISWTVYDSAGDAVAQGGPYTEARKRQVVDLPLTYDDCYTLEFADAGGNGITGTNGRGYYMLHEVGADGKTRLLTQADYTSATHQVFFSLQGTNSGGTATTQGFVPSVATTPQPAFTPAGTPATSGSHLIIYKDRKVINNQSK